jgi:DNA-binding response OmpR family regulator
LNAGRNRILICEDEPDIARLLEMMLSEDGFETDVAATATAAETLLSEHNYDAMTLDLGLPGKHGITLLRELRDNPETRDLPVIVVSATARKGKKQMNCSALGVVDWMEKPINRERLLDNLKRALTSSGNGKSRILHVEDDQDILDVVNSVVGDFAEMKTAKSIAQAKRILIAEQFDLVILDLGLPDGAGEKVLPLLNTKGGKSTPVIVFSAKEISTDKIHNISASLTKSRTTNEMLLETIHSIIDAKQSSRVV